MANFTQTTTYDAPAIAFPPIAGVTAPSNRVPDNEDSNIVIRLVLTSFTAPNRRAKTGIVTTLPIGAGSAWPAGGNVVSFGAQEFNKITIEGTIDTPCTASGSYNIPSLIISDGSLASNHTYGEFIAKCIDGSINTYYTWPIKVDPLWFRDPYGRKWTSLKILDYSATYVESVPGRTQISMTLKV